MKRILLAVMIILSFGLILTSCSDDNNSGKLAENEVYSCPMHPQVVRKEAGPCPICNMDLEKRKATPAEQEKLQKEGNK